MDMPASTMSVSVILATFNRAQYLRTAILSMLAQSHPPLEILVVDDGSTDDTPNVCAEFAQKVRYIRQPSNQGKTAAINLALSKAKGDCIWVMDDDDIAPPEALDRLLQPLRADPDLGFSFGRLQKFSDDKSGRRSFGAPERFPDDDGRVLFARLMEDCFITGQPCVLIRKACFAAIAPLDENVQVSVDYNILLRLARRYDAKCVDCVVLWQRQHSGVRGPARNSYGANDRVKHWAQSDSRLLRQLLSELRLPEYLGFRDPEAQLTSPQTRQALLLKASIAARKDLWDIAIAALHEARNTEDLHGLTPIELAALNNFLGCRYGIDSFILDRRKQAALINATRTDALGQEMREAIASRLTFWIWRSLRRCDLRRLIATSAALIRVSGKGIVRVGTAPIRKRLGIGRTSIGNYSGLDHATPARTESNPR